jgi:hypothetical protein
VLAQSGIASAAFTSDVKTTAITASVDLSTGTVVKTLTVALKNIADGTAATTIGWTGVLLGDGWKKSGQYVEVTYAANQIGWGVQVYTDNLNASANPKYAGDPTTNPAQQPAGLIGASNKYLTCPMAILVNDTALTDAQLEVPVQSNPADPGSYFTSGYNKVVGGTPDNREIVWFFLKDINGTVWEDADSDGVIDAGEIKKSFNKPTGYPGADDYATIMSTMGASSGWSSTVSPYLMQRVASTSPIDVYFAAKFTNATELQIYKTNQIYLELYHM